MIGEQEYQAVMDMVYLAACAVRREVPDLERVAEIDLEWLYRVAEYHSMTGITAMALESTGIHDEAFTQAKGKAIRK